jgi:predicted Zn-dependent protease
VRLPISLVLLGAAAAHAAPTRVTVASFVDARGRGALTADEVADRLALAPDLAVAEREHVREAESALQLSGCGDAKSLGALAPRTSGEVLVGGTLAADKLIILVVKPASGAQTTLEVAQPKARADLMAIEIVKRLLAELKQDPPALRRQAMEATDGKSVDKAYELYAQARAKAAARDWDGAIAAADKALAADDRLGRARALISYARLKKNDLAGATAAAAQARDAAPGARETRLAVARADDYSDRVDAAIDAYRAVLEVAPHDAVAHSNLARLFAVKKRNHGEAAREYQAALAAEPVWPIARFNLALSQIELGRAAEAVPGLERLAQDSPQTPGVATTLARALRLAGRPAAAVAVAAKSVEAQPKDSGARAELMLAQAEAGQKKEALATFEAGDKTAPALQLARARMLLALGDLEGAIAAPSGKLPPLYAHELGKTIAVAHLTAHRPKEAADALRAVVDEDPLDAEAHYDLGTALLALKDPSARQHLEKALTIAPHMLAATLALGRLAQDAGDAARAIALYKAAMTAGNDDARLRLALGLAHFRAAHLDDAIAELTVAAAAPAVQADAKYALAEALLAAGRRADAKTAAVQYLTLENRPGRDAQTKRATLLAK